MNIRQWLAGMKKEWLLLSRDWHALMLLFAMPLAFLLIMSLAMQNEFAARAGSKIKVLLSDADRSERSKGFVQALQSSGAATIVETQGDADSIKARLNASRANFAIYVAKGFGATVPNSDEPLSKYVTLYVAPDTSKQTELIFLGALRELLARERLDAVFAPFAALSKLQGKELYFDASLTQPNVSYAYRSGKENQAPSAVQQSVPAWLVFGAFFIVIPLSNTLIRERQQGTARRLRTIPVARPTLLAGKLAPYFIVNQVQVITMLLAGCFLVPLLGGEALQLNGSRVALGLVAAAVSFAAIGYALLIASVTRTTEQATLLGGAGNLIIAAIGGIMVPKFVMPDAMQQLTQVSPMAWGLDGFLNVLLRNGGVNDVLREVGALVFFGMVMLTLAAWAQRRDVES